MADLDRSAIIRAEIGDTALVLKIWRELADLNQRQLAALAGIHYTTISDYETGKTVPQAETVARVTAALGMTAVDREASESYVRRIWLMLRPTPLVEDPPLGLASPASTGEFMALRRQIVETAQHASQYGFRLLVFLFDLLVRIAEAVTGKSGPGKPDA